MQHSHKKAAWLVALLCLAIVLPLSALADETRVVTCGTLNLRAEPNTTSAVIGKYGWGTQVIVKSIDGDWASVQVGGQTGYMYVRYLGVEGSTNTTRYVATNSRGLNLRAAPNGEILCSFPRGTAVTVVATDGAWSKVTVGDKTGYMYSQWLSSKKPSALPSTGATPSTPSIGTAVVNNPRSTQVLFLRSEPSVTSKALGYYRNGKVVTLLEKLDGWYKVSVDGKTGYMMAKYLKVGSSSGSGSATGATATVVNPNGNSYVNFRKAASLNAAVIKRVPVGTKIPVIEKTTDWTKTTIDGVTGFISTWFLKF